MLVVEVGTNLAIPSQLDKIDLAITAGGKTQHTPYSLVGGYSIPIQVGIVEASDGIGTIAVVATGYLNGAPVVNEDAIVSFIEGKSMMLKLFLAAECRDNPCKDPNQTCTTGGVCRSKTFTPNELTVFEPSLASKRRDASQAMPADAPGDSPVWGEVSIDGGAIDVRQDNDTAAVKYDALAAIPDGPATPDTYADAPLPTPDAPNAATDGQDARGDLLPASTDVRDASLDTPVDTSDAGYTLGEVQAGSCSVSGQPKQAGIVCRPAIGPCDVEESCDGKSTDCPADKLASAGKECRPSAGDCDIAETCSGTSVDCPVDGFKQAGTICRLAASVCDVAESCAGSSATCPVDTLASETTVCRASTDGNRCDPAENCTGLSTNCPSDIIYSQPAMPSNVTANPGDLQVTVAWSAAAGATGYNVKRSATSASGYTTLASSPTTSASPYLDAGLSGSTTYYYVVSSINTITTCESANSSQVSATPVGICTPPAAPALTATAGSGIITINWAAVPGAASYSVARSESSGTGYSTLTPAPTGTSYTDGNVTNGKTYYYVVTASNGSCSSGNSNEASASPACIPPDAPAAPTATATINSVTLTWNAPPTATTYQVKRSTTSGFGYVLLQNVGVTTFTDTSVATGTTYYYVLAASNGFCSSANSPEVPVTPSCVPPSAPAVTATPSNNQVSLSWTAPPGAISYLVYRGTTSGGESSTAVSTPTTTNYVDTSVSNGSTYYYVVAASNGSCNSGNSAEVSATPVCTPPSAPGTLTTTPGDAQVSLSWVATTSWGSSGTDTYSISRKTGLGGTYAVIVAAQAGNSYTDTTGLTNGTTYYYKVSASNGSCSSGFNAEVPATPSGICSQGAPGAPAVAINPYSQIQVTWTASSPVPTGGYDIGRSTTSGSGYTNVGHVGNTTLTFTDTSSSLAVGTTYYYEVTANGSCTATSADALIAFTCQTPGVPSPSASNSAGAITITWSTTSGATAYTVYRSTSSGGTYTAISANQTAANYVDPAGGLTNGTTYYYIVNSSNANAQCASAQSSATSARSCTTPATPAGLSATRAGNRAVRLVWTNSSGANMYSVLRSTTSGSGYASIGTASSSPFTDTNAANGTPYYYVVDASSDAGGNCGGVNSAQVSVPSCGVLSGATVAASYFNTTNEYCIVSCDTIAPGNWQDGNMGTRTLYVNSVQTASGAALPALANGGRAFYWTASSTGYSTFISWWNATAVTCP